MTDAKRLTIEIDGKKIEAPQGSRLIDVADQAGIHIPRFCYHKELSIAASCRMCLVDIEKMPKPAPACATTISDGMVVHTRNEKVRAAQKAIMEFLLINHPLDCPICDQGGECELQDVSNEYGQKTSGYIEEKRTTQKKDVGPLVETFMDRCIQCTRCIRYGEEISGLRELGGLNRGDRLEITTYVEHALVSEISGNIIDLCPVGALTAKPSKYRARPWEYVSHPSISIHDGLGTNTYMHTVRGHIARVVTRGNEAINGAWISDRDRFGYESINSSDRALKPKIHNIAKRLTDVSWLEALSATRMLLEGAIKQYGAKDIGFIVSPSATLEELLLIKRLADRLNINNIDFRLSQLDFNGDGDEPTYRSLGLPIEEVNHLDSVMLIGADPRMEVPVLAIRLRNAVKKGAKISLLSSYKTDQLHEYHTDNIAHPADWISILASVLKEVAIHQNIAIHENVSKLVDQANADEKSKMMAEPLINGHQKWIVLGAEAIAHPNFSIIRALSMEIARITQASFGYITQGSNHAGATLTKCFPKEKGLNIAEMFKQKLKTYVFFGAIDPEYDFYLYKESEEALLEAELIISMTPFASEVIRKISTVVLPVAAWGETDGTHINMVGELQSIEAAAIPKGEAKPLWKVLRVLGNLLNVNGSDYASSNEVLDAWKQWVEYSPIENKGNFTDIAPIRSIKEITKNLVAIPMTSIYSTDAYVRRSQALQKTPLAKGKKIMLAHDSVSKITNSDIVQRDQLEIKVSDKVAQNCVRIPTEFAARLAYYEKLPEEIK